MHNCFKWVFPKIGVFPPKWMVKIMENPIKMDDLGVPPFKETPICLMSAKLPLHFLPQILETRLDMFHLLHDA